MNIINQTAKANLRQNKGRNILIGLAIMLTSIMLTAVPIVGYGAYSPRMAAANKVYPTFHGMYRGASEESTEKMKKDDSFEKVGLRQDPGAIVCDKAGILLTSYDKTAASLNRMKLQEGTMPEAEDDIVLSKGMLEALGLKGEVGDRVKLPYQIDEAGGLGIQQEKEFRISGMVKDSQSGDKNKRQMYGAAVSEKFVKANVPVMSRQYRVYVRIAGAENMTTDQIKDRVKEIGTDYDIKETDIVDNGEYLMANYVDPAMYTGIAVIMGIIILAGIITIYSIYYVSMQNKVQEYGKMRAMGATKKQIRSIVFREGLSVAGIAIPVGLLLGSGIGYLIIRMVMTAAGDDLMSKTIVEIIKNGEVTLVEPWMIATAAVTTLLTVCFSLLRPMQIASKVSPVEAIRCHSTQKERRTKRKGYQELNIRKLTASNLSRNRRRTVITILTLGITSVLFMTLATVLSCMSAKNMAQENIKSDYSVNLDYEVGNKMNPGKEMNQIQKQNPLNEELKNQILSIPGVKSVETKLDVMTEVPKYKEDDGTPLLTSITGISSKDMEKLEKSVIKGSFDKEKLESGKGIIVTSRFITSNYENLEPGDSIDVRMRDGDKLISHTFEILAIAEPVRSLVDGASFTMPEEVLQGLCSTDLTSTFDITADKTADKNTKAQLEKLISGNPNLNYDSMENQLETANTSIGLTSNMAYSFLAVLGIVGILNLINTMINSVHVRKQELGMLQAIGLADSQMIRMLQMEGLFYTAGTLVMGLGLGNLAGYGCYLWAKSEGIMDIKHYNYPLIPTVIMIVTILAVQILLTYLVNKNFKKQSLIERIRFSE